MQINQVNAPRSEDSFAADGRGAQAGAQGQDFAAIFASFSALPQGPASSLSALLSSLNAQGAQNFPPREAPRDRSGFEAAPRESLRVTAPREPQARTEGPAPHPHEEESTARSESEQERSASREDEERSSAGSSLPLALTGQQLQPEGAADSESAPGGSAGRTPVFDGEREQEAQNLRLFTALKSQSGDPARQDAARQMMQVSDDKVQVDLKALKDSLQGGQNGPEQGQKELQGLMGRANVLNVEVKHRDLDEVVKGGQSNAQELSTIAESLKLGGRLKSEGSALFGGESGGSFSEGKMPWFMQREAQLQPQSTVSQPVADLQAQVGQALSALQKQAGLSQQGLPDTQSEGLSMPEGVKVKTTTAASQSEPLSFGQQVTADLNGVQKGQKSTPDKTSLASRLSHNAEEIAKQVLAMAAKNLQSVELNLNPGDLGKLKISIDVTGAEEVTRITVAASNPATRSLVGEALPRLRELMYEQGMEVQTELEEGFEGETSQEQAHNGDQSPEQEPGQSKEQESIFAAAPLLARPENDEDLAQSSQNEHTLNFFA